MRVLMTADAVGGVWTYAMSLCRSLGAHDVDVVLAVMGARPSDAQRAEAESLSNVQLHESDFRLEWMQDAREDVAAAGRWLLRLERALAPDIVHLNGYALAALPWRAPVLVVAHSCVLSWWRAVHGTDAPAAWSWYRSAVAAGLRAADLVVAPTRALLDALAVHYGEPRVCRVIPNGIDSTSAVPPIREPIVLAAGRLWDEAKNIAALAQAAPSIRWPVHVAGSDVHPAGGRRAPDNVYALGMLAPDQLREWYRRASILVHPARYEPFGLVPVEAALHHCALVLGDIASLREVWADAACYVDPDDPRDIARAVDDLAADPARLSAAAAAAHARASTLTAAAMTRAYLDSYTVLTTESREVLECAS